MNLVPGLSRRVRPFDMIYLLSFQALEIGRTRVVVGKHQGVSVLRRVQTWVTRILKPPHNEPQAEDIAAE